MFRNLITAVTLAAFGLSLAACSQEDQALRKPPGKYESHRRATDQYGTTYEGDRSIKVERDEYGNKRATIEEEETRDPKGLFNKQTVKKSKKVVKEQDTY